MTARLRPPALDLPDAAAVRWNSFTKVVRQPQDHWPAQICQQPIIAKHLGKRAIALIADPDAAKTILAGPADSFPRWRIYQHVVGRGPGRESLSGADEPQWRKLRQAFTPMFRPEHVAGLTPLFQSAAARAVAAWQAQGETVQFDACLEMTRLTLDVIWRTLFGDEPPPLVDNAAATIHEALLRSETVVQTDMLATLADAAVARAPSPGVLPDNPFDGWNAASGATAPGGLTRQELYDNARGFLGAGHETAALTLTWALWLAARDDETQRRIHDEIDAVAGAGAIEDAHLARLVFTGQVLNETLRLFPPAYVTVRSSRDEVVLAGERLPAGTVLVVCIYALHRHRQWWEEPETFWPDRFGAGEPRHRYAFLPFSAGRHACIGASLGWKETITIFATLMQHFRVSTDATVSIKLHTTATLRPEGPVPITLHRRT
jgi:cytochrome P450